MSNVLGVQIRQCIQNLNHVGTSPLLCQWLVLLLNQIEEFTTLALLNHLKKKKKNSHLLARKYFSHTKHVSVGVVKKS